MITVRMQLDLIPVQRQLSALERSQLPFATSLALNNLAKAAQSDIRTHYRSVFNLRRPEFIEKQGAKIMRFATKRDPVAELGIDPKADFLTKFQQGGQRPVRGTHIAIPSRVRRNKRDIVSRTKRPRSLIDRLGKKKGAGGVFVITEQTARPTDIVRQPGIYQRTGSGGRGGLKLLYAYETTAHIPALLGFIQIAQRTAEQEWPSIFEAALAQALKGAR
jgi:hypothetical protein